MKSKSESVLHSTARLQRTARERADGEARRIPWQWLIEVRIRINDLSMSRIDQPMNQSAQFLQCERRIQSIEWW